MNYFFFQFYHYLLFVIFVFVFFLFSKKGWFSLATEPESESYSKQSRKSTYDLVKIYNRSRKRDEIGFRRIRTFPFFVRLRLRPLGSAYDLVIGVGSRGGRINQSQCTFPRIVIGLFFWRLLPTPTNWFSLDHKRNVSDGVVSGMETLFSVDYKLYASDYDSDSDSVAR